MNKVKLINQLQNFWFISNQSLRSDKALCNFPKMYPQINIFICTSVFTKHSSVVYIVK